MTCQPLTSTFQITQMPATLVLVDMRHWHLDHIDGLKRSPVATLLANCRLALATARGRGWNVAFVSGNGTDHDTDFEGGWIKGFEPWRQDALFDRRTLSCYSSPYFSGAIETNGGAAIIAGFLGDGGCLATGVDAIRAKQHLTFLADAIQDNVSEVLFGGNAMQMLRHFTRLDIASVSSAAWVRNPLLGRADPLTPRIPNMGDHSS